jgi:CheY-like chemotaxis protein
MDHFPGGAPMLESHQAVVSAAASAGAALYALGREPFDVLIADIGMPEQDGYALIRTIRSLTDGRGRLPAIAVTAYASLRERELARAAGYDYHLAKPVEPKQLVATIASARYTRSAAAAEKGAGETPPPDTRSSS